MKEKTKKKLLKKKYCGKYLLQQKKKKKEGYMISLFVVTSKDSHPFEIDKEMNMYGRR